jgi:hypothetical protein
MIAVSAVGLFVIPMLYVAFQNLKSAAEHGEIIL